MSGKPAARLGDPTACPVPGHGNNPITAGSSDVLFDGLPAARMGDASACGGAMASAVIPTVLINGKPAAVAGSVGNHGNVVTAGSGTVVIGSSHNAAPFLAPAALGIAKAVTTAAAVAEAFRSSGPIARTWQEEPGDLAPLGVEEEDEEEELVEQPQQQARQAITLRIGVFFDGTGNNLANAAVTEQCRDDDLQQLGERTLQEVIDYCQRHGFSDSNDDGYFTEAPDGSYGNAPSNVARLYGLYRDDSFQTLDANVREGFLKVYLDGIGTSSGEADSLYGQITGRGDTGILARVKQSQRPSRNNSASSREATPTCKSTLLSSISSVSAAVQRRPGISPTNCSSPAAAYWLAPCDPASTAWSTTSIGLPMPVSTLSACSIPWLPLSTR